MSDLKRNWKKLFSVIDNDSKISSETSLFDQFWDTLPTYPEIFYYPSAGSDLAGLAYTSNRRIKQLSRSGRELKKPELFVFTCLDNFHSFRYEVENGKTFQPDKDTIITVKSCYPLKINREIYRYEISDLYIYKQNDPLEKSDSDAFICEFNIKSPRGGEVETIPLLYIEGENINFYREVLKKNYFSVLYLCTACEGLGFGNCKRSLIKELFAESWFAVTHQLRPEYILSSTDYTMDILLNRHFDRSLFLEDFGDYPSTNSNNIPVVFRVEYDCNIERSFEPKLRPELETRMLEKKSFLQRMQHALKQPLPFLPAGAGELADSLTVNDLPELLPVMNRVVKVFDGKIAVDNFWTYLPTLKADLLKIWRNAEFALKTIEEIEKENGLNLGEKMTDFDGMIHIVEDLDENDEM